MATVVEIIAILERTVITKEALETTRLGKYVNELRRKTTNEMLARRAKDLVRKWRVMIQENNNAAGGSSLCTHIPSAVHQTNGTNLLLHQVSPALRSNVSPGLSPHSSVRCHSSMIGAAGDAGSRLLPGFSYSPLNSLPSEKCVSPSLYFAQSSSVSNTSTSPKSHPLTSQVKLRSSNPDHQSHQFHPSNLVNIDSVPKTHASNKRLRKESPCPEDVPSRKVNRPNGQVIKDYDFMKACVPSQPDLHGDCSRDSISGLSQGSSSCEVVPLHNKVPISDVVFEMTAAVTTATATSTTTTSSVSTATTVTTSTTTATAPFTRLLLCTTIAGNAVTDAINTSKSPATITDTPATAALNTATTTLTTTVSPNSIAIAADTVMGSSCSIASVSSPKIRGRKKPMKVRRASTGASVTQATSVGDILKEKIASKVRTPKVKTTQELVASVQAKTGGISGNLPEDKLTNINVPSPENKPSLAKCILMSRGTPTDALEISRNKTEHIAKFLQSQSELHPIQEDPSIVSLAEMEDLRLQKHLGVLPGSSGGGDNYNSSPAEVSSLSKLSKDILQQSSSSKDSQSASVIVLNIQDRTVEDIIAQLPPIDVDAICWDESVTEGTDSETPIVKDVTEVIISKLHTELIDGLNGNVNDATSCDDSDSFREWHEMVSKKSYQGEFINILPYVVID